MVIQCPTPVIANQFLDLVRLLVDVLYPHGPTRLLDELEHYTEWGEACDLMEQASNVFFVLVRAHRTVGGMFYNHLLNILPYSYPEQKPRPV